ncbi:MAG TPA: alpha/beta fold hydrolase [Myxococcota bacterium]|nr:alpha/beta fold hydrolase [Myxococcota bacterium]
MQHLMPRSYRPAPSQRPPPYIPEAPRVPPGTRRRDAVWRAAAQGVIRPFVHASERLSDRQLRRAGFRDVFVSTPTGSVRASMAHGRGTLPPVAVVHGLSSSVADYGLLLARLTESCQSVIAIDLPGHGKSAPLGQRVTEKRFMAGVTAALDQVISTPTVILGHSLGAYFAARYAAARPGRTLGLALVSPFGAPVDPASRQAYIRMFEVRSRSAAHAVSRRTQPGRWYMHPFMNAATRLRFQEPPMQRLLHSDLAWSQLSPSLLRTLKVPTALIWGGEERMVPRAHQGYFIRHLPPHTFVTTVPGMSHAHPAMGTAPFLASFEAFMRRLPRARWTA